MHNYAYKCISMDNISFAMIFIFRHYFLYSCDALLNYVILCIYSYIYFLISM